MEIVYCSSCQSRLTGNDLQSGRALRFEGRTYCRACAPGTASARPVAPAPAPAPAAGPSRVGTARRAADPRPAPTGPGPLLWAAAAALLVAAAAAVIALLGSHAPAAPAQARPEPAPEESSAAAKPKPKPEADRRAAQWAALSQEVAQACTREAFSVALELLERAQEDGKDADWTWMLRRRQSEIRAQVQERFAGIQGDAAQAKSRGDRAELERLAARVAGWKIPECSLSLADPSPAAAPGAPATPVAPAKPVAGAGGEAEIKPSAGLPGPGPASAAPGAPAVPDASAGSAVVVFDDHLARGWMDWSFSAKRDFAATAPPGGSARCLSVSFERTGAGFYVHAPKLIEASQVAALEFTCQPSGNCPILLAVLVDQDRKFSETPRIDRFGGTPPTGEWKRYEIPISAFKMGNRKISGVVIQAVGSEVRPDRIFFDKILLRLVR